MNNNTLVSVHGYKGDEHQVLNNLPVYEHHKCPIVIFSPVNSRIERVGPHICRFGGNRAYVGPESLNRQRIHLRMLLDYPFEFFLANDSDSFCLTPELPAYLFEQKGVLWSNEVSDMMHPRLRNYRFPRLAFQPPYFFSREVIERLIKVDVAPDVTTPFIDWVMMAWAILSQCPHRSYPDGFSCPTGDPTSASVMIDHVLNRGRVMLHSIKTPKVLNQLLACRKKTITGSPQKVSMKAGYPVVFK